MDDLFITKIRIKNIFHLRNIKINLSSTERKHLILTGKNGSGKTILINAISSNFGSPGNEGVRDLIDRMCTTYKSLLEVRGKGEPEPPVPGMIGPKQSEMLAHSLKQQMAEFYRSNYNVLLSYNSDDIQTIRQQLNNNFRIFNYGIDRRVDFQNVSAITTIDQARQNNSSLLLQYIWNMKGQEAFAYKDGNNKVVEEIGSWIKSFEANMRKILGDESIDFEYDHRHYQIYIRQKGREKYTFNSLPAGYASIMYIITSLIMASESSGVLPTDMRGFVLIDEIENHLHVSLQKNILPLLTSLFPKLQFIVSTHSPFIVNSLENAVVYDLENKVRVEDLSGYSYEGILESYFGVDQYSKGVKERLKEYESLINKEEPALDDLKRMTELRIEFSKIPPFLSREFTLIFDQLELLRMGKGNG